MASQVTYNANKDSRISTSSGTSMGAGASTRNPIGLHQDGVYLYRTLLGFPVSFAGMTSITSAYLKVRTSDQYYCAFGSDPDFRVYGLSSAFSEGSSVSNSTTNSVEWANQPGVRAANVFCTPSESQNVWGTFDITSIIREAFTAGSFYGLRLQANNETTHNDMTEIWSREGGYAPQLIINYETNVGPNPPVNVALPVGGLNPTFTFDHSDNDGDALGSYDLQVSTDASFASVTHQNSVASNGGVSGNHVSVAYAGTALSRGGTYYWRVATRSATGVVGPSGWTTGPAWYVNQLPTVTLQSPASNGAAVEMTYVAGSGGVPQAVIRWAFSDPEGGAQAGYQVVIMTDAGATIRDTGYVGGAASSYVVPDALARNTNYRVTVAVWDSAGETALANFQQFRPQWALAEYRIDLGGVVTGWSTVASSSRPDPSRQLVVTEYASSAAGGAIGTWFSSLSSAALNRWFHWRVYLFAWGGAASPSFTNMELTYTSSVGVPPDGWTVTGQHAIDTSAHVYGTQSLRVTCNGAALNAWQLVPVQKNTDYILSGRVKSDGNSQARLLISTGSTGGAVSQSPMIGSTVDFTRYQTPVWNSGDSDSIYIRAYADGPAGTKAWFDALKLEASRVVTSWNPGLVGAGVSVDAGGIKVDASPKGGATLRLQASAGGARDIVELATRGLRFGGDIEMYSPVANQISFSDMSDEVTHASTAQGGSGTTGGYWWKVASWFFPYQYAGINFIGTALLTGQYAQGRTAAAIVSVGSYQGDVLGTQPIANVRVNTTGELDVSDFKVVNTVVAGGGSAVEFWMRCVWPYFTASFKFQHGNLLPAPQFLFTTYPNGPLVAASSAGTAYIGQGWGGGGSGPSFPTNPYQMQRFFHTGMAQEFYYGGNGRWFTLATYPTPCSLHLDPPLGATTAGRLTPPRASGWTDVYLESFSIGFVISGGTALSAANKWVVTLNPGPGTLNIDSGGINTDRVISSGVDVLAGASRAYWDVNFTKTGTPGGLYQQVYGYFRGVSG